MRIDFFTNTRGFLMGKVKSYGMLKNYVESNFQAIFGILEDIKVNMVTNSDKPAAICNNFELVEDCLPLMDIESINNFEQLLLTNSTARIQLRGYTKRIGGKNAKDLLVRILKRIFADDVARKCSLYGKKNNFRLSNLKILAIIKDTVESEYSLVDKEFEVACSGWFRQANQRFLLAQKKRENEKKIGFNVFTKE